MGTALILAIYFERSTKNHGVSSASQKEAGFKPIQAVVAKHDWLLRRLGCKPVGERVLLAEGLGFILKLTVLILPFAIDGLYLTLVGPFTTSRVMFLLSPAWLVHELYRATMVCRSCQGLLLSPDEL